MCLKGDINKKLDPPPLLVKKPEKKLQLTPSGCETWGQFYKTFYGCSLRIFCNKLECLSLASLSSLV